MSTKGDDSKGEPVKQESAPAEKAPASIPELDQAIPFPGREKWVDYAAYDPGISTFDSEGGEG